MNEVAENETIRVNTCFMNKYIKIIRLFSLFNRFQFACMFVSFVNKNPFRKKKYVLFLEH